MELKRGSRWVAVQPAPNMHRILQRRRVRKLRVVWASLALVALSLAACSALFTAWTWRQTRDLSQSFKILQDRLEQVCVTHFFKKTKQNKTKQKSYILPVWIARIFVQTLIFTRLRLKCFLCNFFCGYWKSSRGVYGKMQSHTSIPPHPPLPPHVLYSIAPFLCLALLLLTNKRSRALTFASSPPRHV